MISSGPSLITAISIYTYVLLCAYADSFVVVLVA